MSEAKIPLKCGKCDFKYEVTFELPMTVEAFVAQSREVKCPECGSSDALMQPSGAFWIDD